MSDTVIHCKGLVKSFKVPKKVEHPNWWSRAASLFHREWEDVQVLKGLDFDIRRGEFVGYIGANGAGKSTTIKLLTGILCPDGGTLRCQGFDPYGQRYAYTYNIGVVFGQKSILEYEIPVSASLELYRHIYEMDEAQFRKRLDFYDEILGLGELLHVPVRKLSFGQRMRCEVAASLLHNPSIVFLDEPTIGLDAVAKREIRQFLKTVNEEDGTTVILTTHDMNDIESLCERVLLIDKGNMIYDGDLDRLKDSYLREKKLRFKVGSLRDDAGYQRLKERATVMATDQEDDHEVWCVDKDVVDVPLFVKELLGCGDFEDLSMSEPELEEVVQHIYEEGRV